jgi:Fe-S cluster assembly iron-binding protein IscA
MNYVAKPDRFDEIIEEEDVKVIIDSKALMALVGTELDYVITDTSEEFVFKNPNEKVYWKIM